MAAPTYTYTYSIDGNAPIAFTPGSTIIAPANLTATAGKYLTINITTTSPGALNPALGATGVNVTLAGSQTAYTNGSSTLSLTVTAVSAIGTRTLGLSQASSGTFTAVSSFLVATLSFSQAPVASVWSIPSQTYGVGTFALVAPKETPVSAGAWSYTSSDTSVATISGSTVTVVKAGTSVITAKQAAAGVYAPVYASATLTVNKAHATVQPWSITSVAYGVGTKTLTPPVTNNSGATWSYTSSNTSVATVSGSTLSIVGVGTSIITATQADGTNILGSSTTATLTVSLGTPSVGVFAITSKTYSPGGTFSLTAPTSGGSSGNWSYASSNLSVATVSGSTVTILTDGSCTITATLSASGNYTSATTSATLVISKATPTLSNFQNISKTFGNTAFNLVAPSSNSSGSWTYTSSNNSVASISGVTVTILSLGTTTITASQAANGSFLTNSITCTLTVAAIVPVVGAIVLPTQIYKAGATFVISDPAKGGSSGTWSYTSSNIGVASISGSTVTLISAGTATITGTISASGSYAQATTSSLLTINSINAPVVGTLALPSPTYGTTTTFSLTAPTSGGSAGTWSYVSSNTSVATISGSTVTIAGAGTTIITATISASSNYSSAQVTANLIVGAATPVIGSLSIPTKTYSPGGTFTITDPSKGSSTGTWTYTSSDTTKATVSSSTVTIIGSGSTTITATLSATANYTQATTTAVLVIDKATPILSAFPAISKTYGNVDFVITAPSSPSSGSWSYDSNNTSVATINGSTVTIIGVGTATITATQQANGNYLAGSVTANFTVSAAIPQIGSFSVSSQTYAPNTSFPLTDPSSGGSSGAWSYTSSNSAIATISGSTITIVGAGSCTITASIAAAGNYLGTSTTATLVVAQSTPSLTWTIPNQVLGTADFSITAPSSPSSGAWSYTSGTPETATVTTSGTVHLVAVGTTTITATQAATTNYNSATTTAVLTVNATGAPNVGTFTVSAKILGDANFNLTAPSSNSSGAWSYSSSDQTVATISGSAVTIIGVGTTTITATQAASGPYASISATATLTVTNPLPSLKLPGNKTIAYSPGAFVSMAVSSNSNGAFTYFLAPGYPSGTSVNPSTGKVIIGAALGSITVLVIQAAGTGFAAIKSSVTAGVITVTQGTPVITPAPIQQIIYSDQSVVNVTAVSTSSAAITYALGSGPASVAPDGTVTLTGTGTVTITASQLPSSDGLFTGVSNATAGTIVVSSNGSIGSSVSFKSPTYIGNTSKLYMAAEDQLVVQPSQLAILTRTYACALPYLNNARSILSVGSTPYTPSRAASYQSVYLFRKPSESNDGAFSRLQCQYYGVRDGGDIKKIYTTTGSEIRSVTGAYTLYGSGLNSTVLSFTAKYVSPIITQQWVQYSSSPLATSLPSLPYETADLFDVIFTNVNLTGNNVSNAPVPLNSLISQIGDFNAAVASIPGLTNAANFAIQDTNPNVSLIAEVISIDSTNYGTVSEITVKYGAAISSGLTFS